MAHTFMGTTWYSSYRMFIFYVLFSLNSDLPLTITVPYKQLTRGKAQSLSLLTICQYNLNDTGIFFITKVYLSLSHTQQNAYLPYKLHIVHKVSRRKQKLLLITSRNLTTVHIMEYILPEVSLCINTMLWCTHLTILVQNKLNIFTHLKPYFFT